MSITMYSTSSSTSPSIANALPQTKHWKASYGRMITTLGVEEISLHNVGKLSCGRTTILCGEENIITTRAI